jgi:hypothetical protein
VDIDECKTNNGGCDKLTTCTNTEGSRTCGACPKGYTGTGVAGCVDVDECATSNGGCNSNANCTNTAGSRSCACKTGFSGDGSTCTDVNECLTNNGGCNSNATCANTAGSRTCACKAGYSGDGITGCADVNECLTNNGGCDTNATCSNTIGSRNCECKAGFSGNGVTCTNINDCSPNPCKNGGSCVDGIGSHTCSCVGVWSGPSCETGTLIVNASAHGKYPNVDWLPPNSGNTTTGYQGVGASLLEYRSYFGFNIPSFSGTVSSVTLNLEVVRYDSPDASESFWVYDVSTPLATVTSLPSPCGPATQCSSIFDDLGSGTTYGSFTLNSSSTGTIKSVVLTPAITGVSNARGGTFTVGITEYTGPGDGGEVVLFNSDTESRIDQLEIKVVP